MSAKKSHDRVTNDVWRPSTLLSRVTLDVRQRHEGSQGSRA